MTSTKKITQRIATALEPIPDKPFIHWDGELPGFGIRVMPKGAKTYLLKYRSPITGKQCKPSIGRVGEIKADAARETAKDWLKLLRIDIDPQIEKAERIDEQREEVGAMTVSELCEKYMEEHAKPFKRSWKDDERTIEKDIKPAFGDKKAKDVIRGDVTALFTKTSKKHPPKANRLVALTRKIYNFAIQNEIPGIERNPATHIIMNPEDPREVYLEPDEINDAITEIQKIERPDVRDAMLLCMVTGSRPSEVLGAEWDHIDLEEGIWRKPSAHTKQKRVHRLVLNPLAKFILENRDRVGRFVFPGGHEGHLSRWAYRRHWKVIREKIERPEVRFYDAARHSFASLLQSQGVDLRMIGKLLGHTQMVTTERYAHFYDGDQRDATDRAAEVIKLDFSRKSA